MPELPDAVFRQDAWMRSLGYRNELFTIDPAAPDTMHVYYRRVDDKPLTWADINEAIGDLAGCCRTEPSLLVLPGWFPDKLRPVAAQWAREHGWEGVVYSG